MLLIEQKNAILQVYKNNVNIVSGKAGTGKSSVIVNLIKSIDKNVDKNHKLNINILTPTAKAKNILIKKLNEDNIDNNNIYTIQHFIYNKLLHINLDNTIFIIDECSMISNDIMDSFLEIIYKYKIIVVFFGDYRQLPSIDTGCVFYKMIESKCISHIELSITYRYNKSKGLLNIVDKILNKEEILETDQCDNVNWIIPKNIKDDILTTSSANNYDIIITPSNKNIYKYTDIIRNIKNPNKKEYIFFNKIKNNNIIFRIGDPVIYEKNYNNIGLYNGMTGKVYDIYNEDNEIIITIKDDIKGNEYNFIPDEEYINYLMPAYIITIHKSQGSEYNNVLVLLINNNMLNKNLLYTATTRAKKKIGLICDKDVLLYGINKEEIRKSLLNIMIKYNYNNIDNDFNDYYCEKDK